MKMEVEVEVDVNDTRLIWLCKRSADRCTRSYYCVNRFEASEKSKRIRTMMLIQIVSNSFSFFSNVQQQPTRLSGEDSSIRIPFSACRIIIPLRWTVLRSRLGL